MGALAGSKTIDLSSQLGHRLHYAQLSLIIINVLITLIIYSGLLQALTFTLLKNYWSERQSLELPLERNSLNQCFLKGE